MNKETINELLDIKESYQMPEKMMKILTDKQQREELFDTFLKHEQDLSYDWFTDYFQEEQGDRKSLKQDFTPLCICKIISELTHDAKIVHDVCAGTGGLTIRTWNNNKNAKYYTEELSKRAVPILLFNLAIRGIEGQVINGNVLTGEIDAVYKLVNDGRYSDIVQVDEYDHVQADAVISNPPYSIQWLNVDDFKNDPRFINYGIPPKSKADYGFLLHGLHNLEHGGVSLYVLPHGVLFRGAKEGEIRRKLIDNFVIDAVIGLPDKLFLNTGIPVCILVLRKNKTTGDILFIDSSREFVANGKQNDMSDDHIENILSAYRMRRNIEKFAYVADLEEIRENDYNLNIPRYVNTFEPEPVPDLNKTIDELIQLDQEIYEAETKLFSLMGELIGTNSDSQKELDQAVNKIKKYREERFNVKS